MGNNVTKNKYPRILVISNNCFSTVTNNGKTLASFFDEYPSENIAQLYFNQEIPSVVKCSNYYRVTDKDILSSIFKKNNICGKRVCPQRSIMAKQSPSTAALLIDRIKKYSFARVIREFLWKSNKWNNDSLNQWLSQFSPEIIFFCAGDSGFAYDITKYIQEKHNTKLVVYITDDYVLPRNSASLLWRLRRNYILTQMRNCIVRSDLFITISKQMQDEYKRLFGKDSIIAVNMTESMKDDNIITEESNVFTLVYAGGLHFERYKTLNMLAKAIQQYNQDVGITRKAYLKIYSTQTPNSKELSYLNVDNASQFCGPLNNCELKAMLNTCDIPVHVEAFDNKSIECTRLSISTKIPEYLSLGKPILAIGPKQVASIEYLSGCAFCITDKNSIFSSLRILLTKIQLREELSKKALLQYSTHHNKESGLNNLLTSILNIHSNGKEQIYE